MAFPTNILSLASAIGSQFLSTAWGGTVDMAAGLNLILADLIAAETKLGTGTSTASANTVLRGTGTGTTAYGQIVSADITDGTIVNGDISGSAAIAYSKLSLGTSIVVGDLASTFYAVGTWTPSVGGDATYTGRSGDYVRVGRVIHAWCTMTINVLGTGSQTVISGLPFSSDRLASATVSRVAAAAANAVTWTAYVNGTVITVDAKNSTGGAASSDAIAVFGNGTTIEITAVYRVAS